MICRDRAGNTISGGEGQDKIIKKLYGTATGRHILKILIKPGVSRAGGWILNRKISKLGIKPFIKKNHINMDEYRQKEYDSYNDFFTRRIKAGKRPVDITESHFVAPCDSRLTAYAIDSKARFSIKNTDYTMASLLLDPDLAAEYEGGMLLLFRLTVADYHRYCYPVSGEKSEDVFIKGCFHTVNPIAAERVHIYKENTRNYTIIENSVFGPVLMMEVGALLVGKISNINKGQTSVKRGEEKGHFEFGGSTIIVCVKKDKLVVDMDILKNTMEEIETKVKYGEKIGEYKY